MDRKKNKKVAKSDILGKYELTETDKQVIKYKLQFPEITHEELALLLDSARQYITKCLNKPVVKKALAELEDNFGANWKDRLIKGKEKASKKLLKLIDSSNPAIAIRACEDVLQLGKLNLDETGNEDNDLNFEGWNDNNA